MKQQSEICKARSLFITRGILNREIIPDPIVYSWVRSKLHNISFELLEVKPNDESLDILSFDKRTSVVLKTLRVLTSDHSMIYLLNYEGRVIYNSNESGFMLPKFTSFLEEAVGTTAAGISLVTGETSVVYGCEHYSKVLTNYVSESYVIDGKEGNNPLIVMVLTPILHSVSHQRIYSQIMMHFNKEEEEMSPLTEKVIKPKENDTVNPVKTMVNTLEIDEIELTSNGDESNLCKEFTLAVIEERTIREAIFHFNWNLKRSSEALGIGRSTLYRKIKEYNIQK